MQCRGPLAVQSGCEVAGPYGQPGTPGCVAGNAVGRRWLHGGWHVARTGCRSQECVRADFTLARSCLENSGENICKWGFYQFTKLRFVWSLPTGHHCPLSCRHAVRLNVVPALAIWLAYTHLKSPIRIAQGITGRPLLSCFPTSPLHIRDTLRPSFLRSCVSVNLECMIQFSRIVVWPPRPTTSCMRAPTATLPYKR